MKRSFWSILLVVLALGLAACRTAPVYNVDKAAVVTATGKGVSADQVRRAIIQAGASLGWSMKETGNGKLVGTLHLRKHMAQVLINYSSKSYSIQYKDSAGLSYDGDLIHQNYNGWVQRLQRNINAQISTL